MAGHPFSLGNPAVCACRGAPDWTFAVTTRLLYFSSKKQDMVLKVFAAAPGFVVPTKVPPNKGEGAEAALLAFNSAVASQELAGIATCTMRDVMGAPGHLLVAGMVSDRGSAARGVLHVRRRRGVGAEEEQA